MSHALNDRHVIARTSHRCDLCRYTIAAGTCHRVYSMAYDGRIFRVREHMACTLHAEGEDDDWYLDEDYVTALRALARFDAIVAEARAA